MDTISEGATARLATTAAELREAETALATAEHAMDVDGVAAGRARVEVLRAFVARLETEAAAERARGAEAEAQDWIEQQRPFLAETREQITTAQLKARAAAAALCEAIRVEGALRRAARQAALGAQLLHARFPDLPTIDGTQLPALEDYARAVLLAVDEMLPRREPELTVGHVVSADEAQRRRDVLQALAEFVRTHARSLPTAVREILERASVPAAPEPPDRGARRTRALRLIPGARA